MADQRITELRLNCGGDGFSDLGILENGVDLTSDEQADPTELVLRSGFWMERSALEHAQPDKIRKSGLAQTKRADILRQASSTQMSTIRIGVDEHNEIKTSTLNGLCSAM